MTEKLPDYESVLSALKHADAVASPSEAHGLLSGLVTMGVVSDISGDTWAKSIFPGTQDVLTDEEIEILSNLFEITRSKINELEFDFQLLLPQDEEPLKTRAQELGSWCKGFVIGLNLGGFKEDSLRSEDCDEAIQRMTEIASIDYISLEISEEDEIAYTEVTEYVRLAVLMIHAELCRQSGSDDSGFESKTIH